MAKVTWPSRNQHGDFDVALASLHEHWMVYLLLVGINLTFGGVALIAMALQARKIVPAAPTPI